MYTYTYVCVYIYIYSYVYIYIYIYIHLERERETFCSRSARPRERSHPNVAQNDVYAHGGRAPHRAVLCPRGPAGAAQRRQPRQVSTWTRSACFARLKGWPALPSPAWSSSTARRWRRTPRQKRRRRWSRARGVRRLLPRHRVGGKIQEEEGGSRGDGRGREQRWRRGTSLGWWC